MKRIAVFVSLLISLTLAAQNPVLVKDVYPGAPGSAIGQIVPTSKYTFFTAEDDDADANRGLYRTDGTSDGTIKLDLTYPSYITSKAEKLTALGDKVIFTGDNFYYYGELWVSDGTQAGTIALERFQPATPRANLATRRVVMDLAVLGDAVLYGVKNNDDHLLLKKTDGTPGAMSVVYDFGTFSHPDTDLALFRVINGILYFNLYDVGAGVDQLWRSDGSTAGTYMIKDFGTSQFVASYYMPAGNNFYIMLVTPGTGNVLWKSDGTAAGTLPVKVISDLPYGQVNNNYPAFAALGSTLYFAGLDAAHGKELWKTDGTEAGTVLVSDINPGTGSSNPVSLTVFNNVLYFAAENPNQGRELYRYSEGVASLVSDIAPGSLSSSPTNLVVSNNTILFAANKDGSGHELWITDGTSDNTRQLADINPLGAANPALLAAVGNEVLFSAADGTTGTELYKYDNTHGVRGITYQAIYVNDNSTTGDKFTTAVGDDANPGTPSAPLASITKAVAMAPPGYVVYVDAGNYTEQVIINKGVQIRGAGKSLTTIVFPESGWVPAPSSDASFQEYGVIQTADNIENVSIRDLTVDGKKIATPTPVWGILSQTGGVIFQCEIKNMANNGIFVRYRGTAPRDVNVSGNYIHHFNYVGINLQGTALTAYTNTNTIDGTGGAYVMSYIAGGDFGPLTNLVLFGNDLRNYNGFGVSVHTATGTIVQNSFTGSGHAINNNGATVNGTCNWFGVLGRSAIAAKITGDVNYTPALISGADASDRDGFQPAAGACSGPLNDFYVNDNNTSGDIYTKAAGDDNNTGSIASPFATITRALQAAQPGDIIYVDAGSYIEQVVVNKSITIKGAGADATTIHMPDAMNLNFMSGTIRTYAVLDAVDLDKVVLQGFTVDGGNKNFDGRLYGIALRSTGGEVSHCEVRNFRNINPYDYAWSAGTPLYVTAGATPRSISLHNNSIHDYFFYGMLLTGAALTVDVHDNVIAGNGVADFAQYGITLSSASGNVYNNTISNMVEFTAKADTESAGITLSNAGNTSVYNNRLIDCEAGIITNGGSYTLRENDIRGSVLYGIESYALNAGSATLTIEHNIIDNQPYGIYIFNGGTGSVHATLTSNSITNSSVSAIRNENATVAASCNWMGAAQAQAIAPLVAGDVTYSPWLVDGTDSDPAATGFQPAANTCAGTPVVITPGAVTPVSCFGETDGATAVSVSGGSLPYSYAWSKEGDDAFAETTENLSLLAAGTYTLLVTDALGTSASHTLVITEPELLVATATGTNVLCNGGTDGSASVEVAGGTAPYAYAWSSGSTESALTGLVAGSYTVTVTDVNGCTATSSYTVTQPAPLKGIVDASDITCHGARNGSVTITARGGVAPYQYSLGQGEYGSVDVFEDLAPGTYAVSVKDANNCIYTEALSITEPEPLSVATTSVTGTCAGSSNGSINVTVSGGTSRYGFSWSGPNGFASSREDLSNLAAGTYNLVVTDFNGCATYRSVTIEEESPINLDGSVQDVTCLGSATGVIDLMVSGGSASNTYSWAGPKGFKATTQDINNVTAGIYTVIVTSASGCSMQATYTVSQPSAALQVTATKTDIMGCDGTGSLAAVATGGVAPYAYSINDGSSQVDGSFTGLSAGSYTVSVTDSKGCMVTTTVSIVDNGGDAYEANERQANAMPISLDVSISARLAARDKDWFRFTASSLSVHRVSVSRSVNGYQFDLYDSRGRVITPLEADASGKTYNLAAGTTYSVQVSGTASLECYHLLVTTEAAAPVTQTRSTESVKVPETAFLQVIAYPNPSVSRFSVQLQGSSEQPLSLRVLDNLGRVIEARSGVAPNTTLTLGASYRPGIYYLEVQQGAERKTIKLVKQSS